MLDCSEMNLDQLADILRSVRNELFKRSPNYRHEARLLNSIINELDD